MHEYLLTHFLAHDLSIKRNADTTLSLPPIEFFLFPPQFAMLKVLEVLDPVKNNLVHFIEKFRYNGQTCLVFEKLDMDLHSMTKMLGRGMTLHEIRPIAHQVTMMWLFNQSIIKGVT